GTCTQSNGITKAEVKEPGDDKYDGTFSFSIDPANETISGTWSAYDARLPVTKRSYELKKSVFEYNANASIEGAEGIIESEWKDINTMVSEPTAEIITADASRLNASAVKLKKED